MKLQHLSWDIHCGPRPDNEYQWKQNSKSINFDFWLFLTLVCFDCAWHQLTLVLIVFPLCFPLVCLQSLQFKSVEANLNIRWWSALCRLPILDTLPRKNILAGVDCDGSPSPWAGCGHMGGWVWTGLDDPTRYDGHLTWAPRRSGSIEYKDRAGVFNFPTWGGWCHGNDDDAPEPSRASIKRLGHWTVALLSVWPSIPILLAEGVLGSYPGQKVDAWARHGWPWQGSQLVLPLQGEGLDRGTLQWAYENALHHPTRPSWLFSFCFALHPHVFPVCWFFLRVNHEPFLGF